MVGWWWGGWWVVMGGLVSGDGWGFSGLAAQNNWSHATHLVVVFVSLQWIHNHYHISQAVRVAQYIFTPPAARTVSLSAFPLTSLSYFSFFFPHPSINPMCPSCYASVFTFMYLLSFSFILRPHTPSFLSCLMCPLSASLWLSHTQLSFSSCVFYFCSVSIHFLILAVAEKASNDPWMQHVGRIFLCCVA